MPKKQQQRRLADMSGEPPTGSRPGGNLAGSLEAAQVAYGQHLRVHGLLLQETLGLRLPLLDEVLRAIAQGAPDAHLEKCLKQAVLGPLAALYDKLEELYAEVSVARETAAQRVTEAGAIGRENFHRLGEALRARFRELRKIAKQEAQARGQLQCLLADAQSVYSQTESRLLGELRDGQGAVREEVRRVRNVLGGEAGLSRAALLAEAWKLDDLLQKLRSLQSQFASRRKEYERLARELLLSLESHLFYEQEWTRCARPLREISRVFDEAGLDLFAHVGGERVELTVFAGEEERKALSRSCLPDFPVVASGTTEQEAETLVGELLELAAAAPEEVVGGAAPPEVAAATEQRSTAPSTSGIPPLKLVCACYARFPGGEGITPKEIYGLLERAGLAGGISREVFVKTAEQASQRGYLTKVGPRRAYWLMTDQRKRDLEGWVMSAVPAGFAEQLETVFRQWVGESSLS